MRAASSVSACLCFLCAVVVGCDGSDGGAPPVPVPPCAVEQGLARVDTGCLSIAFDEATGGPLLCTPGAGADCDDVEDDCVTAPIALPVGQQATLAITLRDSCATGAPVSVGPFGLVDADLGFELLTPLPTNTGVDEALLFVGVTPASPGRIAATVTIESDARNVRDDTGRGQTRFRLLVDGTAP